ncbi:cytochrome C oxidase subunit IV family protein [Marinigracilibium pacificum]|uniref:Cytochrome C oxidase subunit IV family protein n=1 Tax=Marinigracilibium pacificum TaxID=2729599 RepID=A0A848J6T7_9BACT|nr:cytochrome C oxidase subunit IV family protein [Marinigracilibium pacificum]NMM50164.1 cytochrome C oxidase subunit IV family protein [Marinigracilibium pacificum]
MANIQTEHSTTIQPRSKETVNKILKVTLILAVITLIEVGASYVLGRSWVLYSFFIGLTLVKAFYIVSEFMHLKYEVKSLIWAIMLPLLFVIWLLVALRTESAEIFNVKFSDETKTEVPVETQE